MDCCSFGEKEGRVYNLISNICNSCCYSWKITYNINASMAIPIRFFVQNSIMIAAPFHRPHLAGCAIHTRGDPSFLTKEYHTCISDCGEDSHLRLVTGRLLMKQYFLQSSPERNGYHTSFIFIQERRESLWK